MGFLDRFRRPKAPAAPPAASTPTLSNGELAGLASLAARAGKMRELTGAFEIRESGTVEFETSEGSGLILGNKPAQEAAALVRGEHYTHWPEVIRTLKRDGDVDGALALALECVDATEREAQATGLSPAPAYTEMAAVIYRQRKDYDAEIEIIERYLSAREGSASKNPGALTSKLVERLEKAEALRARQRQQ